MAEKSDPVSTPRAPAADSPEQAALKSKREMLKQKLAALNGRTNSAAHDMDSARERSKAQLAEVEAAIKA